MPPIRCPYEEIHEDRILRCTRLAGHADGQHRLKEHARPRRVIEHIDAVRITVTTPEGAPLGAWVTKAGGEHVPTRPADGVVERVELIESALVSPVPPGAPRGAVSLIMGENQPGVDPLPALYADGVVYTQWSLSPAARALVAGGADICIAIHTGGAPLQPLSVAVQGTEEWTR